MRCHLASGLLMLQQAEVACHAAVKYCPAAAARDGWDPSATRASSHSVKDSRSALAQIMLAPRRDKAVGTCAAFQQRHDHMVNGA